MKTALSLVAVCALAIFTVQVNAQEAASATAKCTKCPGSTSTVAAKASCDGEKSCDSGCPVTAAMAKLPKMTYKVGTESTCCSESAKQMAQKEKAPIHFVVGEKTYEDKEKAYVALVEATEAQVNAFITPSTCSKSGKHTVAGKSCACPVTGAKNAELVKAATAKVQMTYVVGKESCACAKSAAEKAKTSGEQLTYKVGEESTCCSLTARLNLAHAKYKAAVQAMASTEKKADEAKSGT